LSQASGRESGKVHPKLGQWDGDAQYSPNKDRKDEGKGGVHMYNWWGGVRLSAALRSTDVDLKR